MLSVALFGMLGVLARYGVDQWLAGEPGAFPLSTFLINIAGSLIAGLIYVFAERQDLSPALQTGLLVGFCGGFTTFSAYALQSVQMMERGKVSVALAYLFVSPVLGLLAAYAPILVMRKI